MNKITIEPNFNLKPSFKKRANYDNRDYMCNECFKMDLDGELSTDIAHQWGIGVIDPSSVQSETNICNECFKLELDESNFLQDIISLLSCMQCGLSLEKNTDLFSKIPGICNHCYLAVANTKHSCIRCDPTFPSPQEAKND
jgi:hypothetical protein